MGVDTDLFLGAKAGRLLDAEAFRALLVDLIAKRVVTRPCALFEGSFKADSLSMPLDFANMASNRVGKTERGCTLRYKGGESKALLSALAKVAYGRRDVAVYFKGFDLEEPKQKALFKREGWYDADLVVFALKARRSISILDFYGGEEEGEVSLDLRHYLTVTGRRTLDDPGAAKKSPLGKVLSAHFGPLVTATGWA